MGKRNTRSKTSPEPPAAPFNTALSGLAALRAELAGDESADELPPTPAPAPTDTVAPSTQGYTLKGKIALHKEKKGRAGKTATRVSGLALESDQLQALARDMKKQLGCGAVVEGQDIVLLGDLTERAGAWLLAHGAKRIV